MKFSGASRGNWHVKNRWWRGRLKLMYIDGFEDLLDEPLGAGFYYNSPTSTYQLSFVLSVCSHPAIQEILNNKTLSPQEIIAILRQKQVLSGLKVIDLGCGRPNLALTVHALGAKAYTADAEDIPGKYKEKLEGHVVVDLNSSNASTVLRNATGGDFDIVTENIIGNTPSTPRGLKTPELERVVEIGRVLLKQGGYLYSTHGWKHQLLRKT